MTDDVSLQQNNDLPSSWPIKTSSNSEIHHEDLPLFPPLLEKKKLEPATQENLIESPVTDEMIEANNFEMIESGKIDDQIKSGVAPLGFEIENDSKNVLKITETFSAVDKNLSDNQIDSEDILNTKIDVNDAEKYKNVTLNNTFSSPQPIQSKKIDDIKLNPNLVKSKKQIPIPHANINEAVKTKHPLTLPPRVIPFSTPAPSVHTKIASVYTQPEARASAWLPWMRTSMWSKKMVKRATRDPEIQNAHAGLPVLKEIKKPNVVYTPVFISPEIPVMDKNVFEPKAEVVRMNYELNFNATSLNATPLASSPTQSISVKEPVVNNLEIQKIKIEPKIIDAIDNEIFGFSDSQKLTNSDIDTIKKVEQILKPKIEDSWDAALFN